MRARDRLYQIAYRQQGYFTAKQAAIAGYADSAPTYHVKTGDWIREYRGIYRLSHFPEAYRPDLMIYWLWSSNREGNPQGIYSHKTALDLHDICDVMPRKVYMTVPSGFRRAIAPPALVCNSGTIQEEEIIWHEGIPITSVYRTLVDMIRHPTISPEQLVMAIDNALAKGDLTQNMLASLRDEFHPDTRLVDLILENIAHEHQSLREA